MPVNYVQSKGKLLAVFVCLSVSHTWPTDVTQILNPKPLEAISIVFFVIKSTRCTNFTNLFFHEILHVSESSSVHHQEFIHCTLSNGICHTGL